jgi:nitrite reductase/ring-hydroxylating ferredoxin subunit
MAENWVDAGAASELSAAPLRRISVQNRDIALSFRDGVFGALANACNHVGGPLGEGRLDGDYVTCPWHHWKFHRATGKGEPGFEEDCVPAYPVRVEDGRVLIDLANASRRNKMPHPPHPLARAVRREAGPLRVCGISTTAMDAANPRFSGSDHLLDHALKAAAAEGAEKRLIRLNDLKFRACLHLAVLDHADGRERPDGPRVRGDRALGGRHHHRLADPLGRGVLALFQDGRAAQLRAERDHHQ